MARIMFLELEVCNPSFNGGKLFGFAILRMNEEINDQYLQLGAKIGVIWSQFVNIYASRMNDDIVP